MGKVVISPNIKKTSERIDISGNVINPKTKEIIEPVEAPYVPPVQPAQPTQSIEEPKSKIESIIESKIEAIINKKLEEVLNKML